ncbi:alpha/beta-hydrolase [Coprinopsis marcescibilis]|uniref:Carboxylic ester hydrolase n=1 Tax=Coprinopsis marcescibilis TaxID=230819 RepID=A0A5C3L553_COPMA|nr:alpha/beta-hydrolase [Coprinopsis marcescibilis]
MNLLLGTILFSCSAYSHGYGQCPAPIVDVGYAKYQGRVNPETLNTEFLGIRYAAPPTGNLRWREPRPPAKEKGLNLAYSPPNRCYQAYPGLSSNGTGSVFEKVVRSSPPTNASPETEDCLFLNVYTPGDDFNKVAKKKLPVIFWIHGGGYILGSATSTGYGGNAAYDGNELIRLSGGKVVVVAIQYRLGLFGFLSSKYVKANGALNAGLLDQQFALQWVQRNIAKFGGDPSRVTIWGQSAGGGSVLQQLIANGGKTSPPLFSNAILSSMFLPAQHRFDHHIFESQFSKVLELTGCAKTKGDPTACLRKAEASVLQSANTRMADEAVWTYGEFSFVPVVDEDLIRESPTRSLKQGRVNSKHTLLTATSAEGFIFIDAGIAPDSLGLGDYVRRLLPFLPAEDVATTVSKYSAFNPGLEQFWHVMNDVYFVCPTYLVATSLNGHTYKAEFAIPPAFHADDMPYYFPNTAPPTGRAFDNDQFSQAFAQAYVDFASSGDPNVKGNTSSILPYWTKWTNSSATEMLFNRTGDAADIRAVKMSADLIGRCEFWASVARYTGQ